MTITYLESANLLQSRGQILSILCTRTALFGHKHSLGRAVTLAPRKVTLLTPPCRPVCVS